MNTRHIALLGLTVSGFLAAALAGCSADTTTKAKPTKDGGAGSTGAGGSSMVGTAGTSVTMGAGGNVITMVGAGGSAGDVAAACTPPDKATKALVAADLLTDLEGAAPGAISAVTPGGGWYSYQDPEVGTTFTPAPATWMPEPGGVAPSVNAVHATGTGFVGPASATNWGAGTGFSLGGSIPGGTMGMVTMPTDVSAYKGLSFMGKSSKMSNVSVQFSTPDTDPGYCTCTAAMLCYTTHAAVVPMLAADWTKYTVNFIDLKQPTYVMTPVPFDPTSLLTINFASDGPVDFDFWVDDVTLIK